MPKITIPFDTFVETAGTEHSEFINALHEYMTENNCKTEIKEAANGYVVSYIHKPSKRTVLNYVFRKKGLMMRIYADNVSSYTESLSNLPDSMKAIITKAGPCKRMLNHEDCNPRCLMGFDFVLDGERQQKCRNSGFMFFLYDEAKPYLLEMVKCEMEARL